MNLQENKEVILKFLAIAVPFLLISIASIGVEYYAFPLMIKLSVIAFLMMFAVTSNSKKSKCRKLWNNSMFFSGIISAAILIINSDL